MTGKTGIFIIVVMLSAVLSLSLFGCASGTVYAEGEEKEGSELYDLGKDVDVDVTFCNLNQRYGGVIRAFVITLDDDYKRSGSHLISELFDVKDPLTKLYTLFKAMGYECELNEAGRLTVVLSSYDSYTDMYINMGLDGYEKDDEDDGSVYKEDKSFYYVVSSTTMKTVFEGLPEKVEACKRVGGGEFKTLTDLIAYIVATFENDGVDENRISLTYEYGTPYTKAITSSGSVAYDAESGINVHTFSFNMKNTDDTITITQKNPNAAGWYTIAILAGLVVVLIPTLIAIFKRKKNRG